MHHRFRRPFILMITCVISCSAAIMAPGEQAHSASSLDAQVSQFLNDSRGSWSYWNVPYQDGKILHDLVLKGGFKNILEIGTSTGHSTIWLAWAASKTDGTVTTVEVDKGRHEIARKNFAKAGVESYIDARLADAHDLVPVLKGPFDFVFCDADKDWYLQYFKDVRTKIRLNGCFTAHNVLWRNDADIKRFLDYVKQDPQFRTTIERGSGEGISVSCKVAE
jgi:caffeoyl-CoA O-methyltransferase